MDERNHGRQQPISDLVGVEAASARLRAVSALQGMLTRRSGERIALDGLCRHLDGAMDGRRAGLNDRLGSGSHLTTVPPER